MKRFPFSRSATTASLLLAAAATAHAQNASRAQPVLTTRNAPVIEQGGRRFRDLAYAPQVELLRYLRANGFKTFIVSGGGLDLMRSFAEDAYGIPPEQVIGSVGKTVFPPVK